MIFFGHFIRFHYLVIGAMAALFAEALPAAWSGPPSPRPTGAGAGRAARISGSTPRSPARTRTASGRSRCRGGVYRN